MKHSISTLKLSGFCLLLPLLCMISCSTSRKLTAPPVLPGIDIIFTGEDAADTVYVTVAPIPTDTTMFLKDYVEAIRTGNSVAYPVKDSTVHINTESVPSVYNISCDIYSLPPVYMRSGDHVNIDVSGLGPVRYQYSGSHFDTPVPHRKEFFDLKSKLFKISRYKLSEQELDSISDRMRALIDVIMAESDPETATRVVSMLDDDFAPYAFERLPAGSENTLYYTNACALRNTGARAENQQQMLTQSLQESAATAEMAFTDLTGERFDIAELRGKWGVIDFWATWCGPCKKGFETMKNLYSGLSDKLEVVAIACGDQEETWRKTVADLDLPWKNYLAPAPESKDGTVAGYPVAAFPTKIIIDPEGILRDYSVGEDENFYTRLQNMMK